MGFLDPWNMQNLLQSNQHLDMTQYSLHRFVKIILDHRSQTSTPYFRTPRILTVMYFQVKFSQFLMQNCLVNTLGTSKLMSECQFSPGFQSNFSHQKSKMANKKYQRRIQKYNRSCALLFRL